MTPWRKHTFRQTVTQFTDPVSARKLKLTIHLFSCESLTMAPCKSLTSSMQQLTNTNSKAKHWWQMWQTHSHLALYTTAQLFWRSSATWLIAWCLFTAPKTNKPSTLFTSSTWNFRLITLGCRVSQKFSWSSSHSWNQQRFLLKQRQVWYSMIQWVAN